MPLEFWLGVVALSGALFFNIIANAQGVGVLPTSEEVAARVNLMRSACAATIEAERSECLLRQRDICVRANTPRHGAMESARGCDFIYENAKTPSGAAQEPGVAVVRTPQEAIALMVSQTANDVIKDPVDLLPRPSQAALFNCRMVGANGMSRENLESYTEFLKNYSEVIQWAERFASTCTATISQIMAVWLGTVHPQATAPIMHFDLSAFRYSVELTLEAKKAFNRLRSSSPTIFGVYMGQPLAIPPCRPFNPAFTCSTLAADKGGLQTVHIKFIPPEKPTWIAGPPDLSLQLYEGKVGSILLRATSFRLLSEALTEKLGQPVHNAVPMHNTAGANWVGEKLVWSTSEYFAEVDCTSFGGVCQSGVEIFYKPYLVWKSGFERESVRRQLGGGRKL